jgi:uncharacterized protein YgiM (DUF1202 family)
MARQFSCPQFRDFWFRRFAGLFVGLLSALSLPAAEFTRDAVAKGERTNVRARPSYDGEVLASLLRGETVTVLAEVEGTEGEPGGNRTWAKVQMPAGVPVWVYGPLVNAQTKRVKGAVLKFRAGPGRNFSELGELKQGDAITEIRQLDGWIQIEPPTNAVAYIAASLLEIPAAAITAPPGDVQPQAAPIAVAPVANPPRVEPLPVVSEPQPVAAVQDVQVETVRQKLPAADGNHDGKPVSKPADDQRAREVVREGVVRRSANIQSPSYFELQSVHGPGGWFRKSEGLLDYLMVEDPDLKLEPFEGRRVFIKGEEWRDERWRTPVLKVQSIQLVL